MMLSSLFMSFSQKNIILEPKLYNNQVLLGMSLENGSTYEDPTVNQKETEFYSC